MTKFALGLLLPVSLFNLQSCAPTSVNSSGGYYPYSVYQPPVVVDYGDYHHHGDHHHHHDGNREKHYHPQNQWDKIAYDTANKNLSSQDIENINQLGGPYPKTSSKKKK